MSKKKGKTAPKKKASKTKTGKAAARAGAARAAAAGGRTVDATIVIFRTGNGNKIRTTPHRLFANPGDHVAWTVVNLVDGTDVPATITWPHDSPWGKEPIDVRGYERKSLGAAPAGEYKYTVSALDAVEDPEVVIPDV
jgi:plastocyanin